MDEIRACLQLVLRQVFDDDAIVLSDSLSAADFENWDSVQHVNIIIAVERHFAIGFATAEISGLKGPDQTIGSLVSLIAKKAGSHHCGPPA